jgi:hypothetical protein
MRRLLRSVGLRGGLAFGITLLVLAVVLVAKLGRQDSDVAPYIPVIQPTSTVDPTSGDDAEVVATPTAYPDDAQVKTAASRFAAAWLRRSLSAQAWHSGLAKLSTKSLAASLEGVDPSGVPATRKTGDPTVTLRTELFAQIAVPMDTGTLRLTLLKQGDEWLVDGVDWDQA